MTAGSLLTDRDGELAKRIADGDSASLGILYDRYHADVRRFIGRLGVPATDAEDLVQQTFLQVLTAARSFDGRAAVRPWLFGVAAIVVRRHRFSVARVARLITRWIAAEDQKVDADLANVVHGKLEAVRAARALARLSPKKREVFVMVVMEEAQGEEVAVALGIPLKTVWTRLHHARKELREHLAEGKP